MESYVKVTSIDAKSVAQWKVRKNAIVTPTTVVCVLTEADGSQVPISATNFGRISIINRPAGSAVALNDNLCSILVCNHEIVMKDLCALCGANLRKEDGRPGERITNTTAKIAMVHNIPELHVSEQKAQELALEDETRLLREKKLVLLVDLDQTLLHTTCLDVPADLPDVHHFRLAGCGPIWYHTKFRPHMTRFLGNIASLYELHIFTFGNRLYAHTIASLLDPDKRYFSHRILSRDEAFDPLAKTGNLKSLFPRGDSMVCIIDDRDEVWSCAPNLIHVRPYRYFPETGDINAPTSEEGFPAVPLPNQLNSVTGDAHVTKTVTREQETESKKMETDQIKSSKTEEIDPVNSAVDSVDSVKMASKIEAGSQKDSEVEAGSQKDSEVEVGSQKDSEVEAGSQKDSEVEAGSQKTSEIEAGSQKDSEVEAGCQKTSEVEARSQKDSEGEVGFDKLLQVGEESKKASKTEVESKKDFEAKLEVKKVYERQQRPKDSLVKKDYPPDNDDYLLHLEATLTRIHSAFYSAPGSLSTSPHDLRVILPQLQSKVLAGCRLVLSGLVPLTRDQSKSRAYRWATLLGAEIQTDLEVTRGEQLRWTTHVVACNIGTQKVKAACRFAQPSKTSKRPHIRIVTPEWLRDCYFLWTRLPETDYPLVGEIDPVPLGFGDFAGSQKRARDNCDGGETGVKKCRLENKDGKSENKKMYAEEEEEAKKCEKDDDTNQLEAQVASYLPRKLALELAENPLMRMSVEVTDKMIEEVDDEISDLDSTSSSSSLDEEGDPEEGGQSTRATRPHGGMRKAGFEEDNSSSEESMTGDYPKGWSPRRGGGARAARVGSSEEDDTREWGTCPEGYDYLDAEETRRALRCGEDCSTSEEEEGGDSEFGEGEESDYDALKAFI